eukprot:Skav232500  [mRNA]  locus=scaffold1096:33698:38011:+ [translate_table: standard]
MPSTTAMFPIPVPFEEVWSDRPHHLGKDRRYRLAVQALVLAGGPTGNFSSLGCGRKAFQLDARLHELEVAMQSLAPSLVHGYLQHEVKVKVPLVNNRDELVPYRPLDYNRLKITGRGEWDCRDFLSDLLYMPFVEPAVNEFDITPPEDAMPDFSKITKADIAGLARVWDAQGLLRMFPRHMAPQDEIGCTKVFNNFKNSSCDRQIGDRRSQNHREGRIPGPSSQLPTGPCLLQVCPRRFHEKVVGSVADRRDFYHQFWITDEKAVKNCLFPFISLDSLKGCDAVAVYEETFVKKKKRRVNRLAEGDYLQGRPSLLVAADQVAVSFGALFQGDHLGVEVATDAHGQLLEEWGLLKDASRLRNGIPLQDDRCVSGLCIDDFFVLSCEALGSDPLDSQSFEEFQRAKAAYNHEGLLGSDDKDIKAADRFRVVGAEVISDEASVRRGTVVVGAPFEKRLGLALVSMASAELNYTSDALHASLVGAWVSLMGFRRPCLALMNEVFGVIPSKELDTLSPRTWSLSRAAADELQVLSCLAPVLCSNIAVPFSQDLYATDASSTMGGIARVRVSQDVAAALWRSADMKGMNVPLMSAAAAIIHEHTDEDYVGPPPELQPLEESRIPRPLGLRFQFLEVFRGAGKITAALVKMGIVCGPVIDLSRSRQYDLKDVRVVQWVIFMMESSRLQSVFVSPPCTSFSCAAHPCVRSYREPRGFDPSDEKTWIGNRLAFAALAIILVALRMMIFGLLEQPRRSKMRWLQEWRRLVAMGARESWLASCNFGSPHRKEFVFLGANCAVEALYRPCLRDHGHIPIAGKYTAPSAVYTDALAWFLAEFIRDHLLAKQRFLERADIEVSGLEDVLSNDLSVSLPWESMDSWTWSSPSHINLLETSATLKLFRHVAQEGGDCKFTYLGDSHVSRSAMARGRSSASSMRPLLKKAAALCVGFGLYPAGRFTPTRLNPGDHPSRGSDIPPPVPSSLVDGASVAVLHFLASLRGFSRWTSNWIRLVLLAAPSVLAVMTSTDSTRRSSPIPLANREWLMDFDSTLGFPGEGPFLSWTFALLLALDLWWMVATAGVGGSAKADAARKSARHGIQLLSGRKVTSTTAFARDWLYEQFLKWLADRGVVAQDIIFGPTSEVEVLNKWLVEYGRWLFAEGKPYYHYSETLNSVTTKRPAVRRSIQEAWDLAFMWGAHEPTTHHVAMPFQVLIAVISTALCWGWSREAAIFALAWGALLRIGEIFQAYRGDLILPSDVGKSIQYVLLRIQEPKTRYRAARRQSGKLEQPDLIEVIQLGLGHLLPHEPLWHLSGPTLRLRLSKVLARLGLPTSGSSCPKPLTLASFRPGGATWLITQTESAELVRRRGRWVSNKIMECYLQEVTSMTYLNQIHPDAKKAVLQGLATFPSLLGAVIQFQKSKIPTSSWFLLLSTGFASCFHSEGGLGEMG